MSSVKILETKDIRNETSGLVKAALSGWLGTALEFMDFQLYSLGAALVFHEIFFYGQSKAMVLILNSTGPRWNVTAAKRSGIQCT